MSKKWIKKLKEVGYPNDIDICIGDYEWGSYQYDTAKCFYDLYFQVRETLSKDNVLELLGINFKFSQKRTFKEIKEIFTKQETSQLKKYNWFTEKEYKREYKKINNVESCDDIMDFYRKSAYDLWTAIEVLIGFIFKGLVISGKNKPTGNFRTGFLCCLAKDYGYISNEKSFKDFDT